jgi:phospholipid transport system substrate-binding protein
MMSRRIFNGGSIVRNLILTTVLALASLSAAAQQAPDEFVREAAKLLDEAVSERKEELAADRQALYKVIDEILLPRFDQRYAAQLVLGRHWRTASEDQRTQFIEAFYRSLLRQYSDGLLEFDLGQLEFRPYRGDPTKDRTVVRTVVTLDDGTEAPVDYGLIQRDSGWKVFDVTIEGISYVRNFRAEFNSEIQATSLEAVIKRLQREASQGTDDANAPADEE